MLLLSVVWPLLRFTVVYGVSFVAPASCYFADAFAAGAFGSPTVEPILAAFDLPKCQEQFYN